MLTIGQVIGLVVGAFFLGCILTVSYIFVIRDSKKLGKYGSVYSSLNPPCREAYKTSVVPPSSGVSSDTSVLYPQLPLRGVPVMDKPGGTVVVGCVLKAEVVNKNMDLYITAQIYDEELYKKIRGSAVTPCSMSHEEEFVRNNEKATD